MKGLLAILLLVSLHVRATDYYVTSFTHGGNDLGSGTSPGTAWATISKLNGSTFAVGDHIYLNRGDVWREQFTLPSSGTAGNNIVLDAYGTGALPIISGADVKTGWTNSGTNVWWVAAPTLDLVFGGYMVAYNGNLCTAVGSTGALTTPNTYFLDVSPSPDRIYVYSTTDPGTQTVEITSRMYGIVTAAGSSSKHHWTIRNIRCQYAGRGGFYFEGPGESTSDHLLGGTIVEFSEAYANRIDGMVAYDHYDSTVWRYNNNTYNGNGYYAWISDEAYFHHNTSAHSIWYTSGAPSDGHGFGGYQSDNIIIRYNNSDDDADQIHVDCGHLPITFDMSYNTCTNSQYGPSGFPNTPNMGFGNLAAGGHGTISYNKLWNGASTALEAYSSQLGPVDIYNNSSYADASHNTDATVYMAAGSLNLNMKNNTWTREFVSGKYVYLSAGSNLPTTMDNNIYYIFNAAGATFRNAWSTNVSTTIAAWRTSTSKDASSLNTDPLFVSTSDLNIQSSSPVIDAGVSVGLSTDLAGNPITGAPDIGAYEYTPVTALSPIRIRGRRAIVQ